MIRHKKVLVTGAAGFIGSNLIDKLLELGNEVIGIDNLITGTMKNLEKALKNNKFTFIKGDITNIENLDDLKDNDFDIIFHQAALVSVIKSVKDPLATNNNNIMGTLKMLEFARKYDIPKFIYASSSSVYGESKDLPKKLTTLTKPISPYGVSKLSGECYSFAYYHTYGIKTVSLRYFNVYGPRQAINEYSGVITIFLNRVLNDKPPIIFGDGTQTRDFTYVDDVVNANILAAEKNNASGKVFNVGYGKQITINELAQKIIELTNKSNLQPVYTDPRPGDIKHSLADISETIKVLGYKPKISIDDGLKLYYNWLINK